MKLAYERWLGGAVGIATNLLLSAFAGGDHFDHQEIVHAVIAPLVLAVPLLIDRSGRNFFVTIIIAVVITESLLLAADPKGGLGIVFFLPFIAITHFFMYMLRKRVTGSSFVEGLKVGFFSSLWYLLVTGVPSLVIRILQWIHPAGM